MNNKKITTLFILIATLTLLGIVGFTIAYFTSSTDFENEFQTGLYQTEATETFVSPENWMPGDTTPKTLTVTNTGNVDVKARVCISEEWTSSNDDTLPNEVGGVSMAIINLDNTSDWTKKGNCYEYSEVLEPNDTTSSFIQSVTFNPEAEADVECTTTTLNGTTTKECTSTGDGYDNATYKLTLTVETVQANKASELWNPIQYVNRQTENQITVGDEISIGGEHFYVVSSDSNETVLLAKYNLLVGNVYDDDTGNYSLVKTLSSSDIGYGLQSSEAKGYVPLEQNETTSRYTGTVPFSGTNYWDNRVCQYTGSTRECTGTIGLLPDYATNGAHYNSSPYPYVYRSNIGNNISPQIVYDPTYGYGNAQNNGYTISYFVEQYKNKLIELGAPNTIAGRLLSQEEAVSLGCSETDGWCSPIYGTAPTWVYSSSYWLGSAGYSDITWNVQFDGAFSTYFFYSESYNGVRPAIVLRTSDI